MSRKFESFMSKVVRPPIDFLEGLFNDQIVYSLLGTFVIVYLICLATSSAMSFCLGHWILGSIFSSIGIFILFVLKSN